MEKLLKIKNIKIDTNIGKEYRINLRNISGKDKDNIRYSPFEGKLIQETIDLLTFRNVKSNYCESFSKIHFAIKHYEIREKRGDGRWSNLLEVKY